MMSGQTRILRKRTEQMGRQSSVQIVMFEVHPMPGGEKDLYQCRWHIVPPVCRRWSLQ